MDQLIRDRYTPDILAEALRRYDIAPGDVDEGGGFESFIYHFTRGGERFILRITHTYRRTAELIHGEVDWINYLAAGGVSVARAVASARGEWIEAVSYTHLDVYKRQPPAQAGQRLAAQRVADGGDEARGHGDNDQRRQ